MKVEKLVLKHFRGIADMELEFHDRVNVLIGANGSGKTAILDCLAIMLSRLIGRIRSTNGTGRFFVERDITIGQTATKDLISVDIDGQSVSWTVTRARRGSPRQSITNLKELRQIAQEIQANHESDRELDFPLAVYYPVNRSVLDIPLRIRKRHPFDQLSAYDQALVGAKNEFRVFFEWFRNREDLMGTTERPQEVKDQFEKLFLAIDSGNLEKAKTYAAKLEKLVGSDPLLVRARTMVRRKEILG